MTVPLFSQLYLLTVLAGGWETRQSRALKRRSRVRNTLRVQESEYHTLPFQADRDAKASVGCILSELFE